LAGRRVAKVVYAIWYRETIRFLRDRGRWLGLVTQPLLYLLLVGYGIAGSMTFRQVPGAGADYVAFLYPGIIGMSVLFTAIFSAVGIIWDREFGFLKEVLAAPVPRWAVAAGKSLGIATVVVVQAAVLLFLAPVARVTPGPAAVLDTLGVAAVAGLALGGLGIAVAARMQTMESFQFVMNLLTLPMFFLSGALYPLRGVPGWLGLLGRIDPLTYAVDALRNVVYGGRPGAAVLIQHPLGLDLAVLAGLAVVLTAAGAWAFERQS
jgi:ABC-2 type transport system permease protein